MLDKLECSKNVDEQDTPSLSSDDSAESEEHRLSSLRMAELRKRRPCNPALLCCDYSLAEQANALGIPGRSEFRGGHLCGECLGLESEVHWDERDGVEDIREKRVMA